MVSANENPVMTISPQSKSAREKKQFSYIHNQHYVKGITTHIYVLVFSHLSNYQEFVKVI